MKRYKSYATWAATVAAFTGTIITPSAGTAAEHTIRLTTLAPRDSSYHKTLQRMGQSWRRASNGSVDLVIYPGGIQGGEAAMVDRMRINQSQASLLSATGLTKIEPGVSGLQVMPMMFRSLDEVDYVGQKLRPVLNKRLRENGFIVLFWGDTGWVRFFTNRPAVTPDDIRKLKLFTWAGHTPTVDLFRASGFNVVPLETGDILTGLQTGLIDGVPMPPFFALASQVYGPAPYMLEINWAPLVGALVIKRQTWEAIPFEIRMKMMAAAHIAGEEITATGRTESVASVRAMETKWGLQVHTPDSATRALWAQQSALAYNTIRGGIVPEEIYDEVQIHLSEYRQNGLSEAVATTTDTNR